MKLPIIHYGDPILRKKTTTIETITDEIRQLVRDMEETMFAEDGIGLAAPQVNHSLALFLIHIPEEDDSPGITHIFINPRIIKHSDDESSDDEACLSIPDVYGSVTRPNKVTITATDLEGREFTKEFTGLEARAIMHENDHINGVLFIDRIRGKERLEIEHELKALRKRQKR